MQETPGSLFEIYSDNDRCTVGPARLDTADSRKPSITGLRSGDRFATARVEATSSVYDPTSVESSARNAVPAIVDAPLSEAIEHRLIAILTSAPGLGETIEVAFKRKEHELAAVFGLLSLPECRTLHKRLTAPGDGDQLAAQFGRLVSSRRARLLTFLADVRRRADLAASR
jgi:hypothetical protein